MSLASSLTRSAWAALGGGPSQLARLSFTGQGALPSTFAVTDVASAAIAVAALSMGELVETPEGETPTITVDRRLASMWFAWSIRPSGWALGPLQGALTGDYRAKDGWIRLHANAPQHQAAAERVLGVAGGPAAVGRRVATWTKEALETAVLEAGGCAAEMRSTEQWLAHPQGRAVGAEPLAHIDATGDCGAPLASRAAPSRPLAGLRVLDLTRVLAGPVATRFLAGFGAEVLRIDPPEWDEPGVVPEVTLGKRCARLDLKRREDRSCFESLLATTQVLIHGYRPAALDRLGYDAAHRRALSPGLVDVALDAYGWSGPWAQRRGFDSLVQMSGGIAQAGMAWKHTDRPVPLPVQALDHATGYLAAAAALRGVATRRRSGCGWRARLSLARTAQWLLDPGPGHTLSALAPESADDRAPGIEATSWGPAERLRAPVVIADIPMHWSLPATALGSAQARWSGPA
ncbi:MAG TPA: CoA transferase [Steroidobacteraceae bacterium]|nr:CoA transferase [Steroidobacteraceae bacterium]